ncbi:hypothetical protein LZ32DRAFT_664529 [Colletotrichum eremochloae]|nr:hypothetical protein LZ32DRAFT_664529 [Colletotrichum eremochloae]
MPEQQSEGNLPTSESTPGPELPIEPVNLGEDTEETQLLEDNDRTESAVTTNLCRINRSVKIVRMRQLPALNGQTTREA